MNAAILYSFRRCPYAMRARLALKYAGITVELREIDLKEPPEALMAISQEAIAPVLQLADGRVIDGSWEIAQWALKQNDPDLWLGENGQYLAESEMLIEMQVVVVTNIAKFITPRTVIEKCPTSQSHLITYAIAN